MLIKLQLEEQYVSLTRKGIEIVTNVQYFTTEYFKYCRVLHWLLQIPFVSYSGTLENHCRALLSWTTTDWFRFFLWVSIFSLVELIYWLLLGKQYMMDWSKTFNKRASHLSNPQKTTLSAVCDWLCQIIHISTHLCSRKCIKSKFRFWWVKSIFWIREI